MYFNARVRTVRSSRSIGSAYCRHASISSGARPILVAWNAQFDVPAARNISAGRGPGKVGHAAPVLVGQPISVALFVVLPFLFLGQGTGSIVTYAAGFRWKMIGRLDCHE
jgi:hypothetical protein